jgi:hypothetical protein
VIKDNITLTYTNSKNMTSADNQQERLKTIGWIVGFVDGEGSFIVTIFHHPKSRMKYGWQVFPELVVTQRATNLNTLKLIQKFLGSGNIYRSKEKGEYGHKEPLYRYAVRSIKELNEKVIPFFEKNRLVSASKKEDFKKFVKVLRMMKRGKHLKYEGLVKIAQIAQTMNRKTPSRFLKSSETIRQTKHII